MIFTSYFANVRNLPDNYIPVSICGKAPNGWRGLEYKTLAPHYEFFVRWKETRDDDYFISCYKERVLKKLNPFNVVMSLHAMLPESIQLNIASPVFTSPDYHIVLVCYEKPSDFCHRHLVADWLNANWIKCEELGL